MDVAPTPTLYAVYNADGSFIGELRYLADKLLRNAPCPLCDITHGLNPRGKACWRASRGAHAAFEWLHRDEQPADLAAFTDGRLPAVVMLKSGIYAEVLSADDLAACEGDFAAFEQLLSQRIQALNAAK
jgi:hypothetical protein